MAVRRYKDLIVWQLADGFKREIFRIASASARAQRDGRYRDQLLSAGSAVSKDIAEGFLRHSAGDFARFLSFALGSLAEAEGRLEDGVELGYFPREDCAEAFRFARRAAVAITRLKVTQQRYARATRTDERLNRR